MSANAKALSREPSQRLARSKMKMMLFYCTEVRRHPSVDARVARDACVGTGESIGGGFAFKKKQTLEPPVGRETDGV